MRAYDGYNHRSGSWRSHYAIDLASDSVHGRIEAVVHYYEQGNVSGPAYSLAYQS